MRVMLVIFMIGGLKMFEQDINSDVGKTLIGYLEESIEETFPFVKMVNIVIDGFKESLDAYTNKQCKYVINNMVTNIRNFYKDTTDYDNKTKKVIIRFYNNRNNEAKRLYRIVSNISDEIKLEYLINLYTNFFSLQTSDEIFINALDFLEKANTYEIGFAIKLYNKEIIDNDLGDIYIKKLVNYNLIDPKWGVLGGPPIDPNAYKLNEYGTNIIKSLVDNRKLI